MGFHKPLIRPAIYFKCDGCTENQLRKMVWTLEFVFQVIFLRIGIPWDSSPFCTTNLGEYVWNFFQASNMQIYTPEI